MALSHEEAAAWEAVNRVLETAFTADRPVTAVGCSGRIEAIAHAERTASGVRIDVVIHEVAKVAI